MEKFKFLLFVFLLFLFIGLKSQTYFYYSPNVQYLNTGTYNSITLYSGAYVIVNSATIKLYADKAITVYPGAVLKIVNSTITRASTSGYDLWNGINVIGDPNYPQIPENTDSYKFFNSPTANYNNMKHGIVFITGTNNTISYAKKALSSWGGSGGGYFEIDKCHFKDNNYSVYLTNYNKFPQNSIIQNSDFDNPNYLPQSSWGVFFYHIYLDKTSIKNSSAIVFKLYNNYFNNTKNYSNLIGVICQGSWINSFLSNFTRLNVGMYFKSNIITSTGAFVTGGLFDRCDRGLVSTGCESIIIDGVMFWINRSVVFGTFPAVVPSALPVGAYIAGSGSYQINNCYTDHPIGQFYGPSGTSYGIIVDNNASLGYGFITKNSLISVNIGVQVQNELSASFLSCNRFSLGTSSTSTYNYDLTITSGTLYPHSGCAPVGVFYNRIPGNKFSQNPTAAGERNIKIPSTNLNYKSPKRFIYKYGTGNDERPYYNTNSKVVTGGCNQPSSCTVNYKNGFSSDFNEYLSASRSYDSLIINNADSADWQMVWYYKNFFLTNIVIGISNQDQFDSAVTVLDNDTSILSKYLLLKILLSQNEFSLAQNLINNLTNNSHEGQLLKKLYNIIIPVLADYSFESLDSTRAQVDSIAKDSGTIAKQARYIVNYIDETNATTAGIENFIPQYLDSIEPIDGIDTSVVNENLYEIDVYPNPFTSIIKADLTNNSGNSGNYTMKLYNSLGTFIDSYADNINNNETKTLQIDSSLLEWGFYYVQFLDGNNDIIQSRIVFKLP